MTGALARPIPASYWAEPDHFLGGEYPGAKGEVTARKKLRALLDAGVTFFLDLTEEGEGGYFPALGSCSRRPSRLGDGSSIGGRPYRT